MLQDHVRSSYVYAPCDHPVNAHQNEPVLLQQLATHLMNLIEYGFVHQTAIHHH